MEVTLDQGNLTAGKLVGTYTGLATKGRYQLRVVRDQEITKLQLYPSDYLLCPICLSCFPALLLLVAQKAHYKEATIIQVS